MRYLTGLLLAINAIAACLIIWIVLDATRVDNVAQVGERETQTIIVLAALSLASTIGLVLRLNWARGRRQQ